MALLARMLFREGYDDQLAGHITYRQPAAPVDVVSVPGLLDAMARRDPRRLVDP